jgi:hypothetical protein
LDEGVVDEGVLDQGQLDEGVVDPGELDRRRGRDLGEGDVDLRRLHRRHRRGRRDRPDERHLDEVVLEQVVVVEPPRVVTSGRASWGVP